MTRRCTYPRKRPIPSTRVRTGRVVEIDAFVGWTTVEVRPLTEAEREALRFTWESHKLIMQRKGRLTRTLIQRHDVEGRSDGWFVEIPSWRR